MTKGKLVAISASRKNDAVIAVKQDNNERDLLIQGINTGAETLLGYPSSDLRGQSLFSILPEDVCEDIESFLEYEPGGNDIGRVLRKMRNFSLLMKSGEALPLVLKIFPLATEDYQNPTFELLMRDKSVQVLHDRVNDELETNENPSTGLASKEAMLPILGHATQYMRQHPEAECTFAVMELNDIAGMSKTSETYVRILQTTRKDFTDCCRTDDVIVNLGDARFGIILFECSQENAKLVTNRLRMKVANNPVVGENNQQISLTCSIAYTRIEGNKSREEPFRYCNKVLDQHQHEAGNRVYEPN
jgi:GGDEF domain-containing protein